MAPGVVSVTAGARGAGAGGLTDLVRERETIKREIDGWLTEALEQTAAPRE